MKDQKHNYRYAKRLGIPVVLKTERGFTTALMSFGTYKNYPLDLFHMEFIIAIRTENNIVDLWMDDETLVLYYTL